MVFSVAYLTARGRGTLEFAGVMDGIIYGSAVGFGFSLAEDLLYLAQYGPEVFVTRRIFGGLATRRSAHWPAWAWDSLRGSGRAS